jgi:hypothetical protein
MKYSRYASQSQLAEGSAIWAEFEVSTKSAKGLDLLRNRA